MHRIGLWLLLPWLTLGCGGPRPSCSATDRATIGTDYLAALLAECADYATLDACPAFPRIHATYESRRKEWVRCSPR